MNLQEVLERAARIFGKKTALLSTDRKLSYKGLYEDSNRVANYLIKRGINKGDRVAILLPNSLEYVVLLLGIMKAGAIAVPLDVKYKDYELTSLFNHCQPAMLISDTTYLEPLNPILNRFTSIKDILDIKEDSDTAATSYERIMTSSPSEKVAVPIEPDESAVIAYTSGPVFFPHGVVLTHRNLVAEAKISAAGFQQTEQDISILFALPLHHVFGLVGIVLTTIYTGGTVVIVPGLSLSGVLETIEKEKVTIFMGVPYVYALLINMARKEGITSNLSSIRLWGSSGAPLSGNIDNDFSKYFGNHLTDFWGLSEASCHITCPPLNGSGVAGSVGKALTGWEIKITDDNRQELPRNRDGEIVIRGLPVMKGYYRNAEETNRVLKDGWLCTGDVGKIDDNGFLFITGRKKDMVIRKGQNIYPGDVEYLLSRYPGIAEVAVVGTNDLLRGEELRAVVRFEPGAGATEQELKEFCLEHIASYKVPRRILIKESIPRTKSGAIDRDAVKILVSSALS